ncbi:MAG: hypothetical protein LBI30_04230 [Holosporales bacterium]|jgi:hypothetical protein|nr:hypothetical protein [Holosporales bacterium]
MRLEMNFKYLALSSALFAGMAFAGEKADVSNQSAPVEAAEQDAGASEGGFSGLYAGGGGGFDSFSVKADKNEKKPVAFGVNGVIGYGYVFPENNLYVGGEALPSLGISFAREGGRVQAFAFHGLGKVGYVFAGKAPVLICALLGFKNVGIEYKNDGEKIDVSGRKTTFCIGASAEYKPVDMDGWAVRADVSYAFNASAKRDNKNKYGAKSVDLECSSWGFRVMGVYGF